MRTFEFDDGKSQKFWNITLLDDGFTVQFGKIGSKGQEQTKSFADAATARREHNKLVAEKVKKGYKETTPGAAKPTPTVASPLRSSIEAALIEHPDDLASYMAYADYLHEQDDPRGEFSQVQLALVNDGHSVADRKKLQKREIELLAAHQRDWLGPMASFLLDQEIGEWQRQIDSYHRVIWRRGWIEELRIDELSDEIAQAVVAQRHMLPLIRSLILLGRDYDSPGFATLLTGDFFANVRFFLIGRTNDSCHQEGRDTTEFVRRMPRLEELHAYARQVDTAALFAMNLPHLRQLTVHHIYAYPLETLAGNKSLGNLTHLSCWPHGLESDATGAYISSEAAQAIFTSPHLKKLQHLTLRLSDTGDEGIAVLVRSGLLKQLKTLDLFGGCITDVGAQALAGCPDLRHLESLNLSSNMLTDVGLRRLRATGIKFESGHQFTPGDREELEYLWEGDPE